jgi:chromosome segregation ATPase
MADPLDGSKGTAGNDDASKGQGTGAGDQGAGKTGAGEAGKTGKTGIEGDQVDLAKLQEILEDRNAKGKQVVDLKAEMKELKASVAKLTPLADAESKRLENEKTELEKNQEKMIELQAKLDSAAKQLSDQELKLTATTAGVAPEYLDVVATMTNKAKAKDDTLDVEAYLNGLKESHKALFSGAQVKQTVATSGGPGAQAESQAQIDSQIAALEKTLLEQGSFMGREKRVELIGKIESLRYCQPKQGG